MKQYQEFLKHIINKGTFVDDRTGVGTISTFGYQMRFDLKKGFPILTTKAVHWKSVITELLWFLRGDSNIKYLHDHNVTIWDEWADEDGELGPIYGVQWLSWIDIKGGIHNQIAALISSLINDPFSRRHIVSAWNVGELEDMALPPCHILFQAYVKEYEDKKYLSLQVYQRSADAFLGVPFNIASYAALTHIIAKRIGMIPDELIWTGGDCHLYVNHQEQANLLLTRRPKKLPQLVIKTKHDKIWFHEPEDFELVGYNPHPTIKAPVAI